jgi:hypothetical protein
MNFWKILNVIAGIGNLMEYALLPGHHWWNLVMDVMCLSIGLNERVK